LPIVLLKIDFVEVDKILFGRVVVIKAAIAPELGFSVVVFFLVKKRLMVSITSSI
jgi:hypothetical protein